MQLFLGRRQLRNLPLQLRDQPHQLVTLRGREVFGLTHSQSIKTCSVPHNPPTDADPANQLRNAHGRRIGSGDYDWSGLRTLKDMEAEVFHAEAWNPRGHFILASEWVHSAPNAGEPLEVGDNSRVFVVGPINGGLTGPADLTSLSIAAVTEALMQNASCSTEDEGRLEEIAIRCKMVGAMCWALDPEILCADCGGYGLVLPRPI